jgi:translation initiation factor IF-2
MIAGSYVAEGKSLTAESLNSKVVIFEGEIDALKRFDDVKEVATNYECGIMIKNYNDLKEAM